MLKKTLQILLLFILFFGSIFLLLVFITNFVLYYPVWGLEGKLKAMDGVASVDNYYSDDGSAAFELVLTNGGRLSLYNVVNNDLDKSKTANFIIREIGDCGSEVKTQGESSNGKDLRLSELNEIFGKSAYIQNLPQLISRYKEVENAFNPCDH